MIQLPYGDQFDKHRLIAYIRSSGRNYIIQGQQAASLVAHTKPQSLDFWLRQFSKNPNTKQAVNSVIDSLVATGLFRFVRDLECPDSGRSCKGIQLAEL